MATYQQSVVITYTASSGPDYTLLDSKVTDALSNNRIKRVVTRDTQNKVITVEVEQEVEIS